MVVEYILTYQENKNDNESTALDCVMPAVKADIKTILNNADILFENLPIKKIYVISPENAKEEFYANNHDERISFLDERELVNVNSVEKIYRAVLGLETGSAGHYTQQFVKMSFAEYTDKKYYLLWDGDTLPLKNIEIFSNDRRPYFDLKTEYHLPYFHTMKKLLPDIYKTVNRSFISEHMLIQTDYMRELISEIESRKDIKGAKYYEKIMNVIIDGNSFSEYETYGNFVTIRHPDKYILREWKSLREGNRFYDNDSIKEHAKWLSGYYDAITFERYHKISRLAYIAKSRRFQQMFSPEAMESLISLSSKGLLLPKIIKLLIPKKLKNFIKRYILKRDSQQPIKI